MIYVTITYTRTSKDNNPFFKVPDELAQQFLQEFKLTGKSIATSVEKSADGMTAVIANTWRSQADLEDYLASPLSEQTRALREVHNTAHSIQQDVTVVADPV